MAYCINCGYTLKPGSNFCEGCGSRLGAAESPKVNSPTTATVPNTASPITARPADELAKNAARIAAVVALVGFFLPWVSCQGLTGPQTVTGVELASRGASGLWIIPVAMLIALGVLLNKGKTLQERATAAKVVIGGGIANVVVLLYYWATFNGAGQRDEFGLGAAMRQAFSIEIGAILSLLGSIAACICGFFHLKSGSEGQLSQSAAAGVQSTPASYESRRD